MYFPSPVQTILNTCHSCIHLMTGIVQNPPALSSFRNENPKEKRMYSLNMTKRGIETSSELPCAWEEARMCHKRQRTLDINLRTSNVCTSAVLKSSIKQDSMLFKMAQYIVNDDAVIQNVVQRGSWSDPEHRNSMLPPF